MHEKPGSHLYSRLIATAILAQIDVNDEIFSSEAAKKNRTKKTRARVNIREREKGISKFVVPSVILANLFSGIASMKAREMECVAVYNIRTSSSSRGSLLLVEAGLLPYQHVAISSPVFADSATAHLESTGTRKRLERKEGKRDIVE